MSRTGTGNLIRCRHMTEQPGEKCQRCGQIIETHVDVCRFNRGGRCNCSAGIGKRVRAERHPKESR